MEGINYLNEFYLKTLLINGSVSSVNESWGKDILLKMEQHVFTDPFNVDIVEDEVKVASYNKLFGSNQESYRWRKIIDSGQSIIINLENKQEVLNGFITQNYLMSSISLFESLMILFKKLLQLAFGKDVYKGKSAKSLIKVFAEKFREQINIIEKRTVKNIALISTVHNLRLFRNCIVHHNSELKEIEEEFIKDKEALMLKRNLFFYKVNDGKLDLNPKSFKQLSDLYSQLAYIVYLCYKNKE